mgnify:CR=1 FL=1
MGADEELIDQITMSRLCGIRPKTAETWRVRGFGPRYVKVGALVRYRNADVRAWMESRTVGSTSEPLPRSAER